MKHDYRAVCTSTGYSRAYYVIKSASFHVNVESALLHLPLLLATHVSNTHFPPSLFLFYWTFLNCAIFFFFLVASLLQNVRKAECRAAATQTTLCAWRECTALILKAFEDIYLFVLCMCTYVPLMLSTLWNILHISQPWHHL